MERIFSQVSRLQLFLEELGQVMEGGKATPIAISVLTLQIVGADRILYAVDYPFNTGDHARAFLEDAPISPADREKIAHGNAEKLLKLSPHII